MATGRWVGQHASTGAREQRSTGRRSGTDEDEALVAARAGQAIGFEALVARHLLLAHRTAVLFGAGADADDVVQEAFLKAFRALDRFRAGESFRPWLLAIVVNETRNLHRAARRRRGLAERMASATRHVDMMPADDQVLADERRRELLAALRDLPERDRAVLTYRYLLDLSEAETARALGWPAGSVKSRTFRALRRLRTLLPAGGSEAVSHDRT